LRLRVEGLVGVDDGVLHHLLVRGQSNFETVLAGMKGDKDALKVGVLSKVATL
jgi:hypothetical protein